METNKSEPKELAEMLNTFVTDELEACFLKNYPHKPTECAGVVEFLCNRTIRETRQVNRFIKAFINRIQIKREKDSERSRALRNEGNDKFAKYQYKNALKLYHKSIRYAEMNTPELSLAYGNSSAAQFKLGDYRACISDCTLALENYPKECFRKRFKITLRLIEALLNVGRRKRARFELELAMDLIDNERFDVEQMDLIGKLRTFEECLIDINEEDQSPSKIAEKEIKNFMSTALDVRKNTAVGRFIVANRDIEQNETLFIETPYVFNVEEIRDDLCCECLFQIQTMYACPDCISVQFCSNNCREQSFHKFECILQQNRIHCGIGHLAMRVVFEEIQSGNKNRTIHDLVTNVDRIPLTTSLLFGLVSKFIAKYFKQITGHNEKSVACAIFSNMCRVQCNASVNLNDDKYILTGLYPSVSLMNHSCQPNITEEYSGKLLTIKANSRIKKGSEIFNCYGVSEKTGDVRVRRDLLQSQYYFICECELCRREEIIKL